MCRYYENFQSFPARERAVRGNGFSLLSPISPYRAVVSLTLYDGAIPASATADIGPVKERAGIPGTSKKTAQDKGARPGFQQSRDLHGWNLCHLLLTRQMTQGPAVLAARIRFLKGCAVRMSPPEQKVTRPHMHEEPKFKIQYSSLVLSQATTWFRTEVILYLSGL